MSLLKVTWMLHGHYPVGIGKYNRIQDAVEAIKDFVFAHSGITYPRYAKSRSGDVIRIDYGAKDCYFLIERVGEDD